MCYCSVYNIWWGCVKNQNQEELPLPSMMIKRNNLELSNHIFTKTAYVMDSDYLTNGLQTNCYTNTNNAYNQYCSLVMFIVEKRKVY